MYTCTHAHSHTHMNTHTHTAASNTWNKFRPGDRAFSITSLDQPNVLLLCTDYHSICMKRPLAAQTHLGEPGASATVPTPRKRVGAVMLLGVGKAGFVEANDRLCIGCDPRGCMTVGPRLSTTTSGVTTWSGVVRRHLCRSTPPRSFADGTRTQFSRRRCCLSSDCKRMCVLSLGRTRRLPLVIGGSGMM